MMRTAISHFIKYALLLALSLLAACQSFHSIASRKPDMTSLTSRLQTLFTQTKTVCFGRFVIDVPATAAVAWGGGMHIEIFENAADKLHEEVAKLEAKYKTQRRFPLTKGLKLYEKTVDGALPDHKIVISQRDFASSDEYGVTKRFRLESLHKMGPHLVRMQMVSMRNKGDGSGFNVPSTIADLNQIARRLRPREETEIPSEPGLCLEHAFLADEPGAAEQNDNYEDARIGFRLAEFPDVHFSIGTVANEKGFDERSSLSERRRRAREYAQRTGQGELYASIQIFREGRRDLATVTGEEALVRMPAMEKSTDAHEFHFKSLGVAKDMLRPSFDIRLNSGVHNNQTRAVRPSIADEEAIALWDRLTSSIRLRPLGGPARTSQAPTPPLPLGELAATGRVCPQTGWWQCVDIGDVEGGRRRLFREGEVLPLIVLLAPGTLWQRLRGEQPAYETATVWKLVAHEPPEPGAPDVNSGAKPRQSSGQATDASTQPPPEQA